MIAAALKLLGLGFLLAVLAAAALATSPVLTIPVAAGIIAGAVVGIRREQHDRESSEVRITGHVNVEDP